MATEDAATDELDEALEDELTDGAKRKKLSGKKLVIFGVIGVLVLALIGGALWFFGIVGGHEEEAGDDHGEPGEHGAVEEVVAPEIVFYDLPEILVTLNSGGRKTNYLKLKIALELNSSAGVQRLEAVLPRIIDNFQVYLRELRVEDLEGSAGLFRLKEELLVRVNASARPVEVTDVLFKEMLVQ